MVRQNLVKVVADEPPDRDVDLGLPQEARIVNDAQEKPSQHQPKRSVRINPRHSGGRAFVWLRCSKNGIASSEDKGLRGTRK